ncbi:hypothetical protein PsorP6_013579 [Peronosclerospora sorghi]|uniref:Uncharacterized protein n=1 Tax=Peronosclerospora sorghi TaxID=230839 RepID=A0ACC0VHE2_9STRA|nr:hypothetical protein PsorP6_013579 [Peronosclerospora sorghi]
MVAIASDNKSSAGTFVSARLLGSTCYGLCELMVFHPFDTIAKRLITNKDPMHSLAVLNQVIFHEAYKKPVLARYRSLFPSLGFAAGYKISQLIYKFGGQLVVKDYMKTNYARFFDHTFGERNAKTMIHATAGSLIGISEIALLPPDVLKIRVQTKPAAIVGKGVLIVKTEGLALYRGAAWTEAHNAPGSFAIFGGSALAKEYIFQLENYNNAKFFQNFVESISGTSDSIIGTSRLDGRTYRLFFLTLSCQLFNAVAQPLDVIKTRIQSQPFDSQKAA